MTGKGRWESTGVEGKAHGERFEKCAGIAKSQDLESRGREWSSSRESEAWKALVPGE